MSSVCIDVFLQGDRISLSERLAANTPSQRTGFQTCYTAMDEIIKSSLRINMKPPPRLLIALIAGALAAGGAFAQPYPSKPIRLIVAQTAGGSADLVARAYAQRLTEQLPSQIVTDNRPA